MTEGSCAKEGPNDWKQCGENEKAMAPFITALMQLSHDQRIIPCSDKEIFQIMNSDSFQMPSYTKF